MYLIIDESGRLNDPDDKVVIFAAVYSLSLVGLDQIVVEARKRIPSKGKRKKEKYYEIKFSNTGDKTREYVLKKINIKDIAIYALIIDKEGRKIPDTPATYIFLISELLQLIKEKQIEHLIIDRHFTNKHQINTFNEGLKAASKRELFIEHIDSNDNAILVFPDFVAGAIRLAIAKKDDKFYKLIKPRVKKVKNTTWKLLKKR